MYKIIFINSRGLLCVSGNKINIVVLESKVKDDSCTKIHFVHKVCLFLKKSILYIAYILCYAESFVVFVNLKFFKEIEIVSRLFLINCKSQI